MTYVIKDRKQNKPNTRAFCHFRRSNQLLSSIHSNYSNLNTKIPVCTRNNPNSDTFIKPIRKRFRSKKMKLIPLPENPNVGNQSTPVPINPTAITIATQKDNPPNLGKGIEPLDPNRMKSPFENSQTDVLTSLYIKSLTNTSYRKPSDSIIRVTESEKLYKIKIGNPLNIIPDIGIL